MLLAITALLSFPFVISHKFSKSRMTITRNRFSCHRTEMMKMSRNVLLKSMWSCNKKVNVSQLRNPRNMKWMGYTIIHQWRIELPLSSNCLVWRLRFHQSRKGKLPVPPSWNQKWIQLPSIKCLSCSSSNLHHSVVYLISSTSMLQQKGKATTSIKISHSITQKRSKLSTNMHSLEIYSFFHLS